MSVPGSSQACLSVRNESEEVGSPTRPVQRLHWVNTPVLVEAIERFEQGRLPRSLALWLAAVLELEAPGSVPLRRSSR
jgi:hypothetical protein